MSGPATLTAGFAWSAAPDERRTNRVQIAPEADPVAAPTGFKHAPGAYVPWAGERGGLRGLMQARIADDAEIAERFGRRVDHASV